MIRNTDPTGPLPAEDDHGRIDLVESNRIYILDSLGAVPILSVAVLSALCWVHFYVDGPLPAQAGPGFKALFLAFGIAGLFAIPAVPYVLAGLIFPRRLTLDEAGLRYQARGFTTSIGWGDISDIALQPRIQLGRYGSTSQTLTSIRGGRQKLRFGPAFGVAPETLARSLEHRARAAGATPSVRNLPPHNTDFKLAIMIVIVMVVFLASLKPIVAGLMALDENRLFVGIILHLPH
ncbi:MAG: hypothetical protein B7Z78_05755 [Rhodospirillales bacterium 20-60-12]|nr:MAG: hypothetical protein B7Z78_05755 [Rhodospirillales bacterium 20-60-12]HQT66537.1 hypothetical protein [Acetobacteraceae bacterium]